MRPRIRAATPAVVLVACLGCATGRAALGSREAEPSYESRREQPGPFRGDEFRYDRMDAPLRVVHDVVAIPAGVGGWEASDWSQLALWSGGIASLMVRTPRSGDSRLDLWFRRELDPRLPAVWTDPMQAALWSGLAVAGLGGWWWADRTDHRDVAQGLSLMGESLAVAHAYHVSIKLLLGREGPRRDGAEPSVLGPGPGMRLYPSGAPSGHAATLYSLLSSGIAYFEPPAWLRIGGHVFVGGLTAFLLVDHRHYASDVLWGSAMGWYVGQWVVDHRAARPSREEDLRPTPARVAVLPLPLADGGGASVIVAF